MLRNFSDLHEAGPRTRQLNSGGFTLAELLLVIALLGILSTVGIGSFMKLTGKAESVALDSSLRALSTGTEAKVLLENLAYVDAATAARDELRGNGSIVIEVQSDAPGSVIARAHFEKGPVPCRQIEISGSSKGEVTDCPADLLPAPASPEAVLGEVDAPPETTPVTVPATTETTPPTTAVPPSVPVTTEAPKAPVLPAEPFRVNLVSSNSKYQWWNNQNEGAWVAEFTFSNSWMRHQYIDISVERHYKNGVVKTTTAKSFYVPANGEATYSLFDNDLKADSRGVRSGVDRVKVSVTRVESSDKDWKKVSWKGDGPEFQVDWPAPK